MPSPMRYQVSDLLVQVCKLAQVELANVLRRAALPVDYCEVPNSGVFAELYFKLWDALTVEAQQPDLPLKLGLEYAHGPFASPLFAFSSSETVEKGLRRLSEFKPLLGPIKLDVMWQEDALSISVLPKNKDCKIPSSLAVFELIYIIEIIRVCSGEHVVPLDMNCPAPNDDNGSMRDHFGLSCRRSDITKLMLSRRDAELRLITRNDMLWKSLEPEFRERLETAQQERTMRIRVKRVLLDHLAGGVTTADDVARHLYTSKRSLQRRLTEEGANFKDILRETRTELSEHYLRKPELGLSEISHLLGFHDPASFFRAYHTWSGKTPAQARRHLLD